MKSNEDYTSYDSKDQTSGLIKRKLKKTAINFIIIVVISQCYLIIKSQTVYEIKINFPTMFEGKYVL